MCSLVVGPDAPNASVRGGAGAANAEREHARHDVPVSRHRVPANRVRNLSPGAAATQSGCDPRAQLVSRPTLPVAEYSGPIRAVAPRTGVEAQLDLLRRRRKPLREIRASSVRATRARTLCAGTRARISPPYDQGAAASSTRCPRKLGDCARDRGDVAIAVRASPRRQRRSARNRSPRPGNAGARNEPAGRSH